MLVSDKILIFSLCVGCFYHKGPALNRVSAISSFISFVARLIRFEKEAVPNENLVSAVRENDPFYIH